MLWNTRYINNAIEQLSNAASAVEADLARVSPLGHTHLNVLGRYTFPPTTTLTTMRPLRDPNATDD